jgi:hypothetical protein
MSGLPNTNKSSGLLKTLLGKLIQKYFSSIFHHLKKQKVMATNSKSQCTLDFGGKKTYDVTEFKFHIVRSCDKTGFPNGDIEGGLLHLTVKSPLKDTTALSAILNKEKDLKGTISLKDADGTQIVREIKYEQGYVIDYNEIYNVASHVSTQTFTVSANKIVFDGVDHDFQWPTI